MTSHLPSSPTQRPSSTDLPKTLDSSSCVQTPSNNSVTSATNANALWFDIKHSSQQCGSEPRVIKRTQTCVHYNEALW